MTSTKRFPDRVVRAIDQSKILGIRAGTKPHRIIGVWVVVVERRVFIRSWGVRKDGWYQAFVEDPRGVLEINGRRIRVRAVQSRSERIRDAVDRAYAEKYDTPASMKYVRGFRLAKRKATTTELLPAETKPRPRRRNAI
jgi:hypothetical protein